MQEASEIRMWPALSPPNSVSLRVIVFSEFGFLSGVLSHTRSMSRCLVKGGSSLSRQPPSAFLQKDPSNHLSNCVSTSSSMNPAMKPMVA